MFTITSGQDNVYYYSRIMQTDGKAAAKVVEFAKKFHDETFIKDDKSFFTTYMETTTGDRNTLALRGSDIYGESDYPGAQWPLHSIRILS